MKLADVQNLKLNLVKEVLQQHMKKYGYTPKSFIISGRKFSFAIKRYSSCHRDEYTLILREDDIPFIVKNYDDVPPTLDEIWNLINSEYKHLRV